MAALAAALGLMLTAAAAHAVTPEESGDTTGHVVAGPAAQLSGYATPVAVIQQGERAVFTSLDLFAHDVTSAEKDEDGNRLFQSDLINVGQSFIHGTEDLDPGTYEFWCTPHKGTMTGTLVVVEGAGQANGSSGNEPSDAQSEWAFFGGDLANSRSSEHGPAPTEVANLEEVWVYETDGEGDFTGTPVTGDGRIYMGAYLGHAIAIDEATGAEAWSVDLNAAGEQARITASAAYHDGEVYLPVSARQGSEYTPYVVALDAATGNELWRNYVNPEQPLGDLYGSPIVWETDEGPGDEPFRALYIGGSSWDSATAGGGGELHLGYLVALDLDNGGETLWRTYMAPGGPSTKTEAKDSDGRSYDGAAVWSTPALDEDTATLYVGTGQGYTYAHDLTNSMVQLDAFTGEMGEHYQATPGDAWQFQNQHEGLDADFGASPQLIEGPDGEKWVGAGQKNSHLVYQLTTEEEPVVPVGTARYHMIDRETMEPVWVTPVGPGYWLGGITGATAYDGERIYGGTFFGQKFALEQADGVPAWVSSTMDVAHLSHSQVANGVVYSVSTFGVLHAWHADTGVPLWAEQLELGGSASGVAITSSGVYAARGLQGPAGSVHAFRVPEG